MRRQVVGELDRPLARTLGYDRDGLDLDDSRVVRRDGSEEVSSDGRPEVGRAHEGLEQVLGEDEGREVILDVVVRHVDVLETEGDVRRRNRSDPPVGLGREDLLLIRRRGRREERISHLVRRLRRDGRDLRGCLRRRLDLAHLLSLDGRGRDLHSEDDITDLRARERRRVDS